MKPNFFVYQRYALQFLLAWGAGSLAVGSVLAVWSRDPLVRQSGLQALLWGAIDAALALFGQRSALRKAERFERGELDSMDVRNEARGLRRLLLINAGLDLGYIAGGAWLMRRFSHRRDRRGMGLGIVLQGLFLLCYDTAFALDLHRRWLKT